MFICVFVFIPDYHVMSGIVFVFYVLSVSLINVRNDSRRVFVVDIICDCCRVRVVSCYIDTECHYYPSAHTRKTRLVGYLLF